MAVDWTSIAVGFGSAVATGAAGLLAFGRQLSSNKALSANDKQQVNMLEWQEKVRESMQTEINALKVDIEEREQTIREYWKTITETQARLQIIESSQDYLKKQNEALSKQVATLTESNQHLAAEVTKLRSALEISR
ncbi:hypothetical protein [Sodalis sp. dw_96]|uniref:hypothetical protein n=1 Tax=Sodalis sp. dw_96 TaxID=2719794 RepID=UPI001BD52E5A|nr:hypothetical protein [Sodalis sp. dw_96]